VCRPPGGPPPPAGPAPAGPGFLTSADSPTTAPS